MSLPHVAEEFYLVADPELRFTAAGMAVASLRLKASSRKKDGDQWVDDKVLWITARAFDKVAEHAAESFTKGDLILVHGRLTTESWETKEGEKRSVIMLLADKVGPSLKFRTTRHGEAKSAPSTDDEAPF